jgi:glutamate-ammonia-ligase adenylyltransferase
MVADDQTHSLPSEREDLERFARFAGFKDRDAFAETLLDHMRKVQRHYVRLFEHTTAQADRLAPTFSKGCRRPRRSTDSWRWLSPAVEVSDTVRRWLAGDYPAFRSGSPARTELVLVLFDCWHSEN